MTVKMVASGVLIGGKWAVDASADKQYLYAYRTDRPGEIHIKCGAEGFVIEVWNTFTNKVEKTMAVPYPYADMEWGYDDI